MMSSSTSMRVLSSWEAAEALVRAHAAVRTRFTLGYTLAGPCPDDDDRRRLERLARAARQLSSLTTDADDTVDTREMRANVEKAAQGRLTDEEIAGVLSLRPRTCGEALLYIPTLHDFSARLGPGGELPKEMPSLARVIAMAEP